MTLIKASNDILLQLRQVVEQVQVGDFKRNIHVLNNSTIGQHTRHTLEFFLCLKNGLTAGTVNYDKRDHDPVIETDKILCLSVMEDIHDFLNNCTENVTLNLAANYTIEGEQVDNIKSNLYRELAYNIEHAIHHMAIIKIGLKEAAPYVHVPAHFGVAISTIKYQKRVSVDS